MKSIAKINLVFLKEIDFLQRDLFLTYNSFLCNNCELNQSFSDHPTLSCQIAFEIETEQMNINRYCIRKADSESLRLLFLNNRLHCSNDANRMLETFYRLYYQYIPKKGNSSTHSSAHSSLTQKSFLYEH